MMEIGAQEAAATPPQPPQQAAQTNVCPACGKPLDANSYFCPNCGKKIKDPPPSTTISKQIMVYLFALFVPPFGIIPAIKYLKSPDHKAKTVGYFTILLTIMSLILTLCLTLGAIVQFNNALNSTQLQNIQNAGL